MDRREFCQATAQAAAASLVGRQAVAAGESTTISALMPRDKSGHRFVLYSDCCSGLPGTPLEANLKAVNRMVARIKPQPEFIAFPGDAVSGYTRDYAALRRQWNYWLGTEMKWIVERKLPLYQSTSNHNTYDAGSAEVFRAVHADLPQNGPAGQEGLAYWFRSDNLLYISTHQPDKQMPIDHDWLDRVLTENADAQYKFVVGHYPVFPVNGYIAWPLWCFPPAKRRPFWDLLVKHDVDAYLASHIIAFDVQAHDGVLQILSGGAGTAHGPGGFMPGSSEYFHAVQVAVDKRGLRYQVHDPTGRVREQLQWPFDLPPVSRWQPVDDRNAATLLVPRDPRREILALRIRGTTAKADRDNVKPSQRGDQTLVCAIDSSEGVEPIWVGIDGDSGRLLVRIVPRSGYGRQTWKGPLLGPEASFDLQLVLHPHMGPGGVLLRANDRSPWTTLASTSSRGVELLKRPRQWAVAHGQSGKTDRPFSGGSLQVTTTHA